MTTDSFIESTAIRARLIKATIVIAFVGGFLLSPRLWMNSGRSFPIIPPIDGMFTLPASVNLVLTTLFVGCSIVWIFYEKKAIGITAIASLLIVIAQDQMRWQPWVYMYLLMLLPYLTLSNDNHPGTTALICLQWVVAGVYVWSGIQKLNSNFLDGTFAQMYKASGIELDFEDWKNVGYVVPLIETLAGFALLVPKFRKIALYTAVLMHLVILFYLSPIVKDINSVVYPWNVAMIFFVVLLFWRVNQNIIVRIPVAIRNVPIAAPVVLVWIFPILNLFGYWDHYLSFSLYSNKPSSFFIAIEESQMDKIDKKFDNYFADIPGLQGGEMIEVNKWALTELNVPFYPEKKSFKKLSLQFCELGIEIDKLIFLELSKKSGKPQYSTFTCQD